MSETELELYGIVGKMFREIRENKGYSLEIGAEHLGIAPKSLQRYECGERKIKIGTIKSLCDFYNIDYYSFIKEAKSRFTDTETDESFSKQGTATSVLLAEDETDLVHTYRKLNTDGKQKLVERADELLTLGYTSNDAKGKLA